MRFGNQQADFLRDSPEAVGQLAWTRLRLWVGEWFLDTAAGTPWATAVLGTGTKATVEPALRARLRGTPGVEAVLEFEANHDVDTRTTAIRAVLATAFGTATVEGVL